MFYHGISVVNLPRFYHGKFTTIFLCFTMINLWWIYHDAFTMVFLPQFDHILAYHSKSVVIYNVCTMVRLPRFHRVFSMVNSVILPWYIIFRSTFLILSLWLVYHNQFYIYRFEAPLVRGTMKHPYDRFSNFLQFIHIWTNGAFGIVR